MKNKLIPGYIFLEFFFPFLFSLGVFLCITITGFVLFNLIDLLVRYGISLELFTELFFYSIPEMLFYSIPMAVLLATLLSTGRLYRDNELIAIQLAGKKLSEIFLPVFLFVFFLSGISIIFGEFVVSKANNRLAQEMYSLRFQKNLPLSKKNFFYKEFENEQLIRSFYAREFNSGIMLKPLIEEFEGDELKRIISAEKAEFKNGRVIFFKGKIIEINNEQDYFTGSFVHYEFPFLQTLEALATESRTPKEMSFPELATHIEKLKQTGEKTGNLEVLLQQKLSLPLTSPIFLLIGIPLALNRKSKNASFGFAFSLVFIFLFYFLIFLFTALGSTGVFPPGLCAWLPNLLFFFPGLFLFYRAN